MNETRERYETFLRHRISELVVQNGISEHYLSLQLGKGDSYIRAITNGLALPSVKELFNIMIYFDMGPTEFFAGLENDSSLQKQIYNDLKELSDEDLQKVKTFIGWIAK